MKKVGIKRTFRPKIDNNNATSCDPSKLSASANNNDNNLITSSSSKGLLRPSRSSSTAPANAISSRSGSSERPVSILGNTPLNQSTAKNDAGFLFKPKGLTQFFQKGTLTRNKKVSIF